MLLYIRCDTAVFQAVKLLKKGGVLVYSTCTVTLAENEEQVAWALQMFPCLSLQPQVSVAVSGTKMDECHQIITYCVFIRSPTLDQKACWELGCRLSSCASSRGSAPSWAGTRPERRPLSLAEPTGTPSGSLSPSSWKSDRGGGVFILTSLQTGTAVFILCRRGASVGRCWQKTLAFLPRRSCSVETAGHVGISSVNTETKKEAWRVHVGTKTERWQMQQCRCCHDNSDDSASAVTADWLDSRARIRK